MKKEKVKKAKKWNSKKRSLIEQGLDFYKIDDGVVYHEDLKRISLIFTISANNLDLMSYYDITNLISSLASNLDSANIKPSFYIQDGVFDIDDNIELYKKASTESNKFEFRRRVIDETIEMLKRKKIRVNKKCSYMIVPVAEEQYKAIEIDELINKSLKDFKDSLSLNIATREEIKQMFAIYGSRLFQQNFPDSEIDFEEEKISLIENRKIAYEYRQLPHIYNFKDLITPISIRFLSDMFHLGGVYSKMYSINSFLATTDSTNLLSELSSIRGVTTKIYLEEMNSKKFNDLLRTHQNSNISSVNHDDILDTVDYNIELENIKETYLRTRKEKRKAYYISIYFQISGKTMKEYLDIKNEFESKASDVNITLDPLETLQKEAYISLAPTGKNIIGKYTKQNIPSDSIANLYPFKETNLLDKEGLYIGEVVGNKQLMLFDPFNKSATRPNQSVLVVGTSGAGKTVLIMKILENLLIQGAYVRNIDIEGVYNRFFEALGGININVAGNSEFCINPLEIRASKEISVGIVEDYISVVRDFIGTYKPNWSEELLDIFEIFLTKAYHLKNINSDTDISLLDHEDYPLLEDVQKLLVQAYEEEKESNKREKLDQLITGLTSAVSGADSKIFNRYTNLGGISIEEHRFINFDMSDIQSSALSRKLAQWMNILTFNAQFIDANLSRKKRIALCIDEVHTILKENYLMLVERLGHFERTFRKREAAFIKGTQTLDEVFTKNEVLADKVNVLFSQPTYKFLFHLGDIDYDQPKKLLNLKDSEITEIKKARVGECLLRVGKETYNLAVDLPRWYTQVKSDIEKKH